MAWIPIAAWMVAAVVALVVLGYCAYELTWKTKRLRRDVAGLTATAEGLQTVRGQLEQAQRRLAASRQG